MPLREDSGWVPGRGPEDPDAPTPLPVGRVEYPPRAVVYPPAPSVVRPAQTQTEADVANSPTHLDVLIEIRDLLRTLVERE